MEIMQSELVLVENRAAGADGENPAVLHRNRLPSRAIVIPALTEGVFYRNKEASALLQSLCGDYRFCYRLADELTAFEAEDYDDSDWDILDVPSVWQYRGYGRCSYPNTEYPIPFCPPYVCGENPVGYYRRRFTAKAGERSVLHFAGVDNAFYVYLNGVFVGFSKGSRNVAEFDVTALLRTGENLLAVKVLTYSDATYLENQDMLLASGIFRDVYLLSTDRVSVWDYRVTNDGAGFTVAVMLTEPGEDYRLTVSVDGTVQTFPADKTVTAHFPLEKPHLWNNEEPFLYTLRLELTRQGVRRECHEKRIGMMSSCVAGNRLLVNGNPVYLKGVNYHEYDCDNGRAVSVVQIERDLRLLKAHHFNAVRCAHYPHHPAFYELCTELGMLVMDEADLETHGCIASGGDQGELSKNPHWREAYLDRVQRLMEEHKNETCVCIWSMGNECGEGENILAAARWAKAFDPCHVVMHDQEISLQQLRDGQYGEEDVIQRAGYLSLAELRAVEAAQPILVQVEYAHAMGNSPGFLLGYQREVYRDGNYIGGFIWEFKNHGFHTVTKAGRDRYLYGGDFGDKNHWSNFCLDGLCLSNGKPKPGFFEAAAVFSPVYATFEAGCVTVKNTYNFKNIGGVRMRYEIREDTAVQREGTVILPSCPPHETCDIWLDMAGDTPVPGAVYYLNLHFLEGDTPIGAAQFRLAETAKPRYEAGNFTGTVTIQEKTVMVVGKTFSATFRGGLLCSYAAGGTVLLSEPLRMSFYRAPTDNDGVMTLPWMRRHAGEWRDQLLDTMTFFAETVTVVHKSDRAVICAKGKIVPLARRYGFEAVLTYCVYESGVITVSLEAVPFGAFPETLPRLGVCLPLSAEPDTVTWYGRGPQENYGDSLTAAPVGRYTAPVAETYTVFDRPQETGNHEDTAYVRVYRAENGAGVCVTGCDTFAFSCHDFSLDSLDRAQHCDELEKSEDRVYLYLDYRMRGLGSHACGPEPEESFELRPHAFSLAFTLSADDGDGAALGRCRQDFGVKTGPLGGEQADRLTVGKASREPQQLL